MNLRGNKALAIAILLIPVPLLCFIWLRPQQTYEGKPLPEWIRELEQSNGDSNQTVQALCRAGPVVVPALIRGLNKKEPRYYRVVWEGFPNFLQKRMGRPANYRSLRFRCAFVLGHIQPSSPEIVRELSWAVGTEDDVLTTFAAQALGMVAEREVGMAVELERVLPKLRSLVARGQDERGQVARAWAVIVGRSQPIAPEVTRELRQFLLCTTNDALCDDAARSLRLIAERDVHGTSESEKALIELRQAMAAGRDEKGELARAVASLEKQAARKGL